MCIGVVCVLGAGTSSQKKKLDSLELELLAVVSHLMRALGTELLSSGRPVTLTAEPFLHPAPGSTFFKKNNNLHYIKCKGRG